MCNIQKARIAYAGPALTDGEMDVRELAPALIAFAEFVSNAGKAIGCERNIKVMLNQDSLNKGYFEVRNPAGKNRQEACGRGEKI